MNRILPVLIFLLFSHVSFAQCEVQTDFGDVAFGLAPDSITDFAPATLGNIYAQQLDVKVPTDGAFFEPSLPFVVVDSAVIAGIAGLPEGLSYECNSPLTTSCAFEGGSTGCGVISGIPSQAGTFNLIINVDFYTNFSAAPIGFPLVNYRIVVDDPLSINDGLNLEYSDLRILPNPVKDVFKLQTTARKSGLGNLRIFDLLGQEVYSNSVQIKEGQNTFNVSAAEFSEGIYILRLDAFGSSRSARMVVLE
jgi:hypothetical protein